MFERGDLIEGILLLIGTGESLGGLQLDSHLVHAFGHPFDVAGIAAEQVVAQGQPVLHHLRVQLGNGLLHFQRLRRRLLGAMFAAQGQHIDDEQNENRRENRAETAVKPLVNRHCHERVPLLQRCAFLVFCLKGKFNNACGFVGSRLELPPADSIFGGTHEHWVSAHHFCAFHLAIASYGDHQFHSSPDGHASRQFGVGRLYSGLNPLR